MFEHKHTLSPQRRLIITDTEFFYRRWAELGSNELLK